MEWNKTKTIPQSKYGSGTLSTETAEALVVLSLLGVDEIACVKAGKPVPGRKSSPVGLLITHIQTAARKLASKKFKVYQRGDSVYVQRIH